MSEPVSNSEIEDVLSSIRRLVSENAGPIRRSQDDEETPNKLVLTPAFRVDEESAEEEDAPGSQDEAAADESPASDSGGEDQVEVSWQEGEPAPQDNAEAGADAPIEQADESAEKTGDAPLVDDGETADQEAEAGEPAPPVGEDTARTELERRIAELEAVIARSATEFEPDGSEAETMPESVVFRHHGHADRPEAEAEPDNREAAVVEAQEPASTDDAARDDVLADAEAGEPPLAEPEDVVGAGPTEPEITDDHTDAEPAGGENAAADPESGFAEDLSFEDWESVADVSFVGDNALEGDAEPVSPEAMIEETVLDEDALRELVSRMVREELQGVVGERITHNVRRMVRREISRALSLQSFE